MDLREIGIKAKEASKAAAALGTAEKNAFLLKCADDLVANSAALIKANELDMKRAAEINMPKGLQDRLLLDESRIKGMANGLRDLVALPDPIGEVNDMKKRPNGLLIGKKTVPLGVVGIIYEARPNVTSDAFGLCFKTGNAVILKGGSDAINSNIAIVDCMRRSLTEAGISEDVLQLIKDTDRKTTSEFMKMNEFVDVLIPRGGAGLIKAVVENSNIPVIETGTGNCHIFVDESGKLDDAVNIIINAKTQRVGVCNACESILIHEKIADKILPELSEKLASHNVEMRTDEQSAKYVKNAVPATEDDWGREYLDYIVSIKTVSGIDEAIDHINKYNTGHSESIITENYTNAQRFLDEVDAAAVYVNASTRFTDGGEFGLGAEVGISTQKLHARGPMGLEALTTIKYIIYGNGQIR